MHLHLSAAAAALVLVAGPALAHDHSPPAPVAPASSAPASLAVPEGAIAVMPAAGGPRFAGFEPAARDAWLADCRSKLAARDRGIGGAVIGGVAGGLVGNRVAGKHNRTLGTVAGAAIGAVAGAAIDRAEDAGRNRDECEAYLDDYYARYTQGGYAFGYGYPQAGPGQPMMLVPMASAQPQRHCTETVEYVYEDVPVRAGPHRRHIPPRGRIVPDKRVRLVPDKRTTAR